MKLKMRSYLINYFVVSDFNDHSKGIHYLFQDQVYFDEIYKLPQKYFNYVYFYSSIMYRGGRDFMKKIIICIAFAVTARGNSQNCWQI